MQRRRHLPWLHHNNSSDCTFVRVTCMMLEAWTTVMLPGSRSARAPSDPPCGVLLGCRALACANGLARVAAGLLHACQSSLSFYLLLHPAACTTPGLNLPAWHHAMGSFSRHSSSRSAPADLLPSPSLWRVSNSREAAFLPFATLEIACPLQLMVDLLLCFNQSQ